jgi:ATP-dependent exoDNAse (exonuclease V) beta subunit
MTHASDQSGRDLAVDVSRSVIVEAGAGSGKTASLVIRKLGLLAMSKHPEEVLSITFTRKATAEMRHRVIHALRSVANGATPTNPYEEALFENAGAALDRDREMGWNLLENPSRLRIVTFDALAHMIVRMSPITSQLGGPVAIQEDASTLYDRAVDRLFQALDGSTIDGLSDSVFKFLQLMDNRQPRARAFLTNLLARRDQWLGYVLSAQDREGFYQLVNESTQDLANGTVRSGMNLIDQSGVGASLAQLWRYAAENGAKSDLVQAMAEHSHFPEDDEADLTFWQGLGSLLLTNGGTFRKRLTAAEGFPAASKLKGEAKKEAANMKEMFATAQGYLLEASRDAEKIMQRCANAPEQLPTGSKALELMDTLVDILPILAADLQVVFSEEGVADHNHVFQAALQALGNDFAPGEASLVLDYQISHLLVDEYQDTSKPQTQLLKRLTAGWEAGDSRTLFLVGDPKQSIYKFRDANVSNFLSARKLGVGDIKLEPAYLTENFRSHSSIIEWNNRVYGPAFPAEENIARSEVTFAPSTVPANTPVGENVTIRGFSGEPVACAQSEAQYMASKIQETQAKHPEDSIAILVRNRSHLRQILPILKEHKIAWKAADIDPLSSLGVVSDLLALTRAIVNPMDKLAWVALLHSPLVGLTMSEIHMHIGESNHAWSALNNASLSKQGESCNLVRRFRGVMTETLRRFRRKSLRQLVEGTWVALGGPSVARELSEQEAARKVLDLVSAHELGGTTLDIDDLDRAVSRLYASDLSSADQAVEIMTIHKAKGLQFDTVFLPGLAGGSRPDDKSLLYWDEWLNEEGQYRMAMAPMAPPGTRDVALYDFLREQEAEKSRQERTRLLYVATTRPKKRLFMTFGVGVTQDGGFGQPASSSLMGVVWDSVKDSTLITFAEEQIRREKHSMIVHRLDSTWRFNSEDLVSPLAGFRGPEVGFGKDNVPELSWDNAVSAAAGTVFHRFFQHLHDTGVRSVNAADAASHKHFWEKELRAHGLPIGKLNQGIEIVRRSFCGLDTEDGRWLLADHSRKQAEMPVTVVVDGEIEDLVIDLTFVDGGKRWIVDTKTSSPVPGEHESAFIARELNRYHEKMEAYGAAVQHLGKEPVCLALYLPSIGRVATYSSNSAAA